MIHDIDDLEWLSLWLKKHCDGDWEHENGFNLYTVSNPGWAMCVDLSETKAETLLFDTGLVEHNDEDWYWIKSENGKFEAHGDLSKVTFLIKKFREIMESCGETI